MAERLQNLPLAGAAGAIVENGRKDLQALMEANEKSYQGLQAVVQLPVDMDGDEERRRRGAKRPISAA